MNSLDKAIALQNQICQIQNDHFMHSTLFSVKWWILIFIAILFIFIWLKLVDKVRLQEITLFGFIIATLTLILDNSGTEMVLWTYPIQMFEIVNHIGDMELVLVPISFMLLYQYFPEWKKYIIMLIVFSAVGAFIGVPLAVWFGLYKLIKWSYIYSFIVFIVMGLLTKFIVSRIMHIQKQLLSNKSVNSEQ